MKNTKKQHQGSVVMMFLLALPVIITMMAVALDTGRAYISKTELQNVVDACALAAATELDGTSTQFSRAQTAGVQIANMHKVGMQKTNVAMTTADVTFSDTLDGTYGATASPARFVRCSLNETVDKLIQVPGLANSDTISAQAKAGLVPAQTPCALPMGVCSSALSTSTPVGMWIGGVVGGNGTNGNNNSKPGSLGSTACNGTNGPNCTCNGGSCFRWAHFGTGSGGASALQNLLTGDNTCNINLNGQTVTEQPGSASSPYDEYNTRFGVNKNNGVINVDFTGYAYTSPVSGGRYPDYLTRKASYTKYQNANLQGGYNNIITPTASNAKSRRVGVAPILNCAGTTTNATDWVCVLMVNPITSAGGSANRTLYLEYLGKASTGACSSMSMAGGSATATGSTVSALVQ